MSKWKSLAYKFLRISNDINAVKRGKVGKRIGRRIAGKATGNGCVTCSNVDRRLCFGVAVFACPRY